MPLPPPRALIEPSKLDEYDRKAAAIAATKSAEQLQGVQGLYITPAVELAILDSGNPETAWYLAEHPELIGRLNMSGNAFMELGRIESEMNRRPERPKAPKPPTPLRMSRADTFDALDDSLAGKEWERRRTAQLRAQGKSLW